jgi:hypothetical protein
VGVLVSTVVLSGDREAGDLPAFRGVLDVVQLLDRLCRRPRFGDVAGTPGRRERRAQAGLPLVCLIRSPQQDGLVGGLVRRLAEARPSRVPHCHVVLSPVGDSARGSNEFTVDDVQKVREILAYAATVLGSSRNARGGRIRFRRFGLLDWLMSQDLERSHDARRQSELRARLRRRDVVQRFDDAITSAGRDLPALSGWLRVFATLLRLAPPVLFAVRVTGRLPLAGELYRWFLRQPHVTPEVPGGFLGFAERLTAGRDGWQHEDPIQVARLLTNAFLEDLRRAWRFPWRFGGPRRMTYAVLFLDDITAGNGGYALLQLINDVRNEIGRFDPLLVIGAGRRVPPDGSELTDDEVDPQIYFASNAESAYRAWRNSLRDARRARTDTAWYLRLSVPDALEGHERADLRQQVDGLDPYRVERPPWWGRRVVPVATVVVLVAGLVAGYVSFSDRHCEDGWQPPAAGSTLRWISGECVGVTDGHYTFDPALADVTQRILNQNKAAAEAFREQPNRAYFTLLDLQALTPPPGNTDGLAAERESLEGAAVAQAQALGDPSFPLIRLLIGNAGMGMAYGTTVAAQLRGLPATAAPLVGVVGLDHSTQATDNTVLALAVDGLPTVASSLSEDQLADSNPLYYQVSPQNRREASVAAVFATTLRNSGQIGNQVAVYYPADANDTYARNLTNDVAASFGRNGFSTQEIPFAPSGTPPSKIPPGVLYPAQNGRNACGFPGLVYYAGDGVPDFNAFLDGMRQCPTPPALLADDDVTRYVADTNAREQNQSVPYWYTSFATAPTSTPQGPASNFYGGPVGLYALFPGEQNPREDPSLDGHAALSYDAVQTVVAGVNHLRLGNALIPITPGDVWREINNIRSSAPSPDKPNPNNDDVQGVTGLIDFGSATGAVLHYPANKQVSILQVQQGAVKDLAFFCGDPADSRQSPRCPLDEG